MFIESMPHLVYELVAVAIVLVSLVVGRLVRPDSPGVWLLWSMTIALLWPLVIVTVLAGTFTWLMGFILSWAAATIMGVPFVSDHWFPWR